MPAALAREDGSVGAEETTEDLHGSNRDESDRDEAIQEKVVAAVVRRAGTGWEVLAFDHPLAGTQLVKGTVEEGEAPEVAVRRELHEESGLVVGAAGAEIGLWEQSPDRHRWRVYVLPAPVGLPDRWSHLPVGSPAEEGLVFHFRWLPIDGRLGTSLHPLYAAVARMLLDAHR